MNYIDQHLNETIEIVTKLDKTHIFEIISEIVKVKNSNGRIFFLGVGGSAANCSHAVNDFRKIIGVECYAPTDNVSELTARTNDDGWHSVFIEWLKVSRLNSSDLIFVLSVGGGNLEKNISINLVEALKYSKSIGCRIVGIVGNDGGYTSRVSDACLVIPNINASNVTPHTEAFQGLIWHLIVSHPLLKKNKTKWEDINTV